ncbi:MAG: hypothetical protein QMB61_05160 [Clostridiaceae bacterium]
MKNQAKSIKILEELIRYFTFHQVNDLMIHFDSSKESLNISISGATDDPPNDMAQLEELLKAGRRPEFEEYYWGLLGSSSTRNELSLLGALVDDGTVAFADGVLKVTITRHE